MLSVKRYKIKDRRLSQWVNFIWHLETDFEVTLHQKLLPTNAIDLILNLSESITYETELGRFATGKFYLNGMRHRHAFIEQRGRLQVWGISFFSYGLYPFIKIPLTEINHQIVELEDIARALSVRLEEVFSSQQSGDDVPRRIEETLIAALDFEAINQNVAGLLHTFTSADAGSKIGEFCARYCLSEKSLERYFLKYSGMTPKVIQRIKRFQRVSNQLVHQENKTGFAGLAQENDYCDQSHFIREFKTFSGVRPGVFIKEKTAVKQNLNYSYW